MSARSIVPLSFLLIAGCSTAPAVGAHTKLRPGTRTECEARCGQLEMRLAAVVLVMNAEGCVCEPAGAAPRAATGVGAVNGAVLVRAAEEQEAARQAQRRASIGAAQR